MTAKKEIKTEPIKKVVKKEPVKKKTPLLVVTDKETIFYLNWIMIRRKINNFTKTILSIFKKPVVKKPDKINTDIKKIDLKNADKKLKGGLKDV